MKTFKIGKFEIGPEHKAFIIAEMSGNHDGAIEKAFAIIDAAKEAGADAVKLQTYTADTITLDCNKSDFRLPPGPWEDFSNLHTLYSKAYTPWEWHAELFEHARKIGLEIFSSPFDHTAVDFLEKLSPTAYKIASPEITDIPLIEKVARTGKPVILSTGVADLKDIELAVNSLRENNCERFVILKCTTAYPTPMSEVNLNTMLDMKNRFDCLVGVSDHTLGLTVPMAAAALGANVIEKHFAINKEETVDSFFSLDVEEFTQMVNGVRETELCLGKIDYNLSPKANINGRRSLYISKDVKQGDIFTAENVRSVRPAMGLHPKYYSSILGKKAKVDLALGDRMSLDFVDV
jgi:N-acetylneuraminate synthase/pseudaminic acid synthase